MTEKNQKSALRAELIAKRLKIAPDLAKNAADLVAGQLLELIPKNAVVAGYCAMRGEIDVMSLLAELAVRGHQICLPVIQEPKSSSLRGAESDVAIQKKSNQNWIAASATPPRNDASAQKILKFLSWSPSDELCAGKFGALCPPPHLPELVPDIVIVPLVGFDANLHRLGYGGGYYDSTIADLRAKNKQVRIIGAAYNIQRVEKLPVEIHDERLDAVVTESGCLSF